MSGYEVCKAVREAGLRVPIIMLTARKEEFDRVLGFDLGTDDYVTKPFSIKELLARVRAVLRRAAGDSGAPREYRFGDFTMDLESRTLRQKGQDIPLTRTEFDVLVCLLREEGGVVSRQQLLRDVWRIAFDPGTNVVDVLVHRLRDKIDRDFESKILATVRGAGYVLRA